MLGWFWMNVREFIYECAIFALNLSRTRVALLLFLQMYFPRTDAYVSYHRQSGPMFSLVQYDFVPIVQSENHHGTTQLEMCSNFGIISLTKLGSGWRCRTFSHNVNVSSNLIFKIGKFVSLKTRHLSTAVSLASIVFCTAVNRFSTSLSFRFSCDCHPKIEENKWEKSFDCHMMNSNKSWTTAIVAESPYLKFLQEIYSFATQKLTMIENACVNLTNIWKRTRWELNWMKSAEVAI